MKRGRDIWSGLTPAMADALADRVFLVATLAMCFKGQDPQKIADRYGIDRGMVEDIQAAKIERLFPTTLREILAAVEADGEPPSLTR
jgi:hypothetical protein